MILRPWAILLAAGGSGRFGGPKLLARIDGVSLVRRAAQALLDARPAGCTVVLGARAARMRRELRGLPLSIVVNRRWRRGLSSSLQAGLRTLPRDAPAALVLLADQACVGADSLLRLERRWQGAPRAIACAWHGASFGPPAIFPRSVFPSLERLRGDAGARALIERRRRRVLRIEMPEAAWDVDRPEDHDRAKTWRRG